MGGIGFGQSRRAVRFGPPLDDEVLLVEVADSLGLQDDVVAELGIVDGADPQQIALARVFLDSETENLSNLDVRHPSRYYEGRIQSFGTINRSVALPPDLPQTSSAQIKIIDTDGRWRGLLAPRTARRRKIETRVGIEDASEITFQTVYSGEIQKASFMTGGVEIAYLDTFFAWMKEKMPSLIRADVFPNLPTSSVRDFYPWPVGAVSSSGFGDRGAYRLPYIDTFYYRYAVSIQAVANVTAVYRKAVDDTDYALVDPGEYIVFSQPAVIDGVIYNLTYLEFDSDQGKDTEIRADVEGLYDIAAFGTLPANRDGGVMRNVVDAMIWVLYFTEQKHHQEHAYEFASWDRAWHVADDLGLVADFVIDEQMTWGEIIGRLQASSGLSLYQNRDGKLAIAIPGDENPDPPEFDDVRLIYADSVNQEFLDRTYNRMNYSFGRLYGWSGNALHESQWGAIDTFENYEDQIALGGPDGPIIEEESIELWCCRDAATAAWVMEQRARYCSLDTLIVRFAVSLPASISKLELTREILLTHYGGVKEGGFVRERMQVIALDEDLDAMETTVTCIRRAPEPELQITEELSLTDSAEIEEEPQCLLFEEDFSGGPFGVLNDIGAKFFVNVGHAPVDLIYNAVYLEAVPSSARFVYDAGSGHGLVGIAANFATYALPAPKHALLGTAHFLSEATIVDDNSILTGFASGGPSLFMSGVASGHALYGYQVSSNWPTFGDASLVRVNAGVANVLGATFPALVVTDRVTLTAELLGGGATVRLRVYVNGVQVHTFDDSTGDRLTTGDMGGQLLFCSSGHYIQWDDWVCATPV